jgi:hypothetical protein
MLRMSMLSVAALLAACGGGGTTMTPPPSSPAPAVGATAGVATGAQLSVTMGQQFPLHVGQSASVAGVSSVITLRAVRNDSRCPSGTQCVQAGNAEVVLDVARGGGAPSSLTLNTTTPPSETALGNGILRLISLSPAPLAGTTIDQSAYVATLCVCRQ